MLAAQKERGAMRGSWLVVAGEEQGIMVATGRVGFSAIVIYII